MPFAGTTQRSPDARSSTATVWAPSTTFASPGTSAASVMLTIAGSTLATVELVSSTTSTVVPACSTS